jgi:hypothetical protein
MGLFSHKHPESVAAVDPRHPHEYRAPSSTWRTGCDICGLEPEDARHKVAKAQAEPEVQSEFSWPS